MTVCSLSVRLMRRYHMYQTTFFPRPGTSTTSIRGSFNSIFMVQISDLSWTFGAGSTVRKLLPLGNCASARAGIKASENADKAKQRRGMAIESSRVGVAPQKIHFQL